MLNMDLIESSSESEDAESLDSLSDQSEDDSDATTSCSSSTDTETGHYSDTNPHDEGEELVEDEYDRIFNRGLSTSSVENSPGEETDELEGNEDGELKTSDDQALDVERLESTATKRRSDDKDPTDDDGFQSKTRRLRCVPPLIVVVFANRPVTL